MRLLGMVAALALMATACSSGPATRATVATTSTTSSTTSTTAPPTTTSIARTPTTSGSPSPALVPVDPSITVEMRYFTSDNFTGAPLPGYQANKALLRPAAAAALLRVERVVRGQGLTLVVYDAYRPVRATLAMVAWAHRTGHDSYVGPYIASRSEHNLGVAVDLTLADLTTGQPLDMGAPFDTFSPAAGYPGGATGAALTNRTRLRDVMMAGGWAPYDSEWWHFSYPVPGATALDVVIQ